MKRFVPVAALAALVLTATTAFAADSTLVRRTSRLDLRDGAAPAALDGAALRLDARRARLANPADGLVPFDPTADEPIVDGLSVVRGGLALDRQRVPVSMKVVPSPRFVLDRIGLEAGELAELQALKTPRSHPMLDRVAAPDLKNQ